MNKIENKIGLSIGIVVTVLLFLMLFGSDIDVLNKGRVLTPSGIGDGVFYSMTDYLTYNVFIVGCILSILYVILLIGSRSKK
ncbi:hypothetical protein [Chryseobacterium sp. MYb328]|uniref:hypothetical protein n=1 Tax=Chryseobacterium sp. MYb328 TaxID=2745231 RepID=UPI0030ABD573